MYTYAGTFALHQNGGECTKLFSLLLLAEFVVNSRNFTLLLTVGMYACVCVCINPIVRISKFKQFIFILRSLTVAYGNIT